MPYKHIDVVKAWLDGKTVQYFAKGLGSWKDVESKAVYVDILPCFSNSAEFRIKPEPILVKYRRYFYEGSNGLFSVYIVNEYAVISSFEKLVGFRGWIDKDWVTAEYEPKD